MDGSNSTRSNAWTPYAPTHEDPWDLRRVVHLHRRAGFAARWAEIQQDLAEGPEASIDRLLEGKARSPGVPSEFERVAELLADAAVASRDPARLKAWWIYRMLFGPDPMGERLALVWHNHFATSNLKVNNLAAMRQQNEIFREFARAPFGDLLGKVVRDPAVLIWLDAQVNRKEHPNENLARELMELFTLGVGHYTETDVKEAARTLTGWTVTDSATFCEVANRHDDGKKTILGHTGNWRGDDLIQILLDQPATAERLALRICEMLMAEGAVDRDAIQSLAAGLRAHRLDIGWGINQVLHSQAFFTEQNIAKRILGPVEFVVGSVRAMEQLNPPPSTVVLAEWCARLGQDLFYAPNVFGWPGGRAWITTRSIIGRTNFASALVEGGLSGRGTPMDAVAVMRKRRRAADLDSAVAFYSDLVFGGTPPETVRQRLDAVLSSSSGAEPGTIRRVIALLLASPEAQLS